MAAGEGIAGWVLQNAPAGLHPREGARRPAHQVLPRARGGEVPVDRVRAADRQGPARDRRDRAARRGPARLQPAGRGLPAPRRLARGLRDRERAPLRAHARRSLRELERLSQLSARTSRAPSRSTTCCSVTVEQALGLLGAESLRIYLARAERRPPAHARGLARRARRPRHRLAARAERRAAAHAGERRHADLGARGHALGRGRRCARRSSRRSSPATRSWASSSRGSPTTGRASERRARSRQLDRVADRARPQAAAARRAARPSAT